MDETALGDALHQVLKGEAPLPGSLVARLVEEFRDREHRRVAVPQGAAARLTGREWDVLELMRTGASTAEISERLFISPTTVRSHVSTILKKLGVPDREAAVKLFEEGSFTRGLTAGASAPSGLPTDRFPSGGEPRSILFVRSRQYTALAWLA